MKIAFLCTSGADNASPRGRWLPVASELARLGHQPSVFLLHPTFGAASAAERSYNQRGVHIEHVAQMHVYGQPGAQHHFGGAALARVSAAAALALYRAAMRAKPNAIHVCKPQPMNALAGMLAARRLAVPFYVDCDDYEAEANHFGSAWQKRVVRWWEDYTPLRAQGVTVNTRFLRDRCMTLGVAAARIAHVPNGIMLERFPVAPAHHDGRTVLYLGAMRIASHGVDLLIDAFAHVRAQQPDARLLMVGDGPDRSQLEQQARTLGIADAIQWAGAVEPGNVQMFYARATCSVDPVSDTPAMRGRSALKIVESLACGVPVVTGAVGDRHETLRAETQSACGETVAPGEAKSLAAGILRLLRDSAHRDALASRARARAVDYDWSALAQIWAQIYAHTVT